MKKIGITGSIGSGKSTVTAIFAALHIPIYDADTRAKILMVENADLVHSIKQLFGNDAYNIDGSLNRKRIAEKAFAEKEILSQLNALVHPAVFADFDDWCIKQKSFYVIKEAALLFESNSFKQVDEVIVVTAPQELRLQRAINRDGSTREAVMNRMNNQFSEAEKLARAQYQIINDEQHLLIPQVLELHQKFLLKH